MDEIKEIKYSGRPESIVNIVKRLESGKKIKLFGFNDARDLRTLVCGLNDYITLPGTLLKQIIDEKELTYEIHKLK